MYVTYKVRMKELTYIPWRHHQGNGFLEKKHRNGKERIHKVSPLHGETQIIVLLN